MTGIVLSNRLRALCCNVNLDIDNTVECAPFISSKVIEVGDFVSLPGHMMIRSRNKLYVGFRRVFNPVRYPLYVVERIRLRKGCLSPEDQLTLRMVHDSSGVYCYDEDGKSVVTIRGDCRRVYSKARVQNDPRCTLDWPLFP